MGAKLARVDEEWIIGTMWQTQLSEPTVPFGDGFYNLFMVFFGDGLSLTPWFLNCHEHLRFELWLSIFSNMGIQGATKKVPNKLERNQHSYDWSKNDWRRRDSDKMRRHERALDRSKCFASSSIAGMRTPWWQNLWSFVGIGCQHFN